MAVLQNIITDSQPVQARFYSSRHDWLSLVEVCLISNYNL